MKETGLMGGLHFLSVWIMRLAIINIIWFVCNLPIMIISFFLIFAEDVSVVFVLLLLLFLLAPFLLFPSTAALFSSVREWLIGKEEHLSLLNRFITFYKENFKSSLLAGCMITLLWMIWAVDFYYFSGENLIFMMIFLIMGMLLFVFTVNYFSVHAHYDMSVFTALKTALILTLGRPVLTIIIVLSSGLIGYTSLTKVLPLIPFFSISLIACISFSSFYSQFLKMKEKLA